MELTQLTFAVDTTPLDTADKKIRGLGEALKTLERPMSAIAKDSATVASGVEEVASNAQAAGSKLKGVEASLEKVSTAMKIFRGETVEVGDEVVNLGSSFTKSQANFLALQKQLGASADQLKSFAKEFNDFNKITSANTFDNSIAGVQRLTKDIRELSEVNKLAAANTTLTRDQVMNLVRDTERLQQAMQSMGKSNDEINASIAQQTQQYVNLANEKNKLIAQTKAMEDSAKAAASAELERAKASAYVTKEAEKLAFVNAQLKEGFTVSSANALYKYKEALDLTGVSADQAKTKLAAFGEQLKSKQSSSPFAALVKDAEETRKQVNHLARDVSVQLGDIAISLAGGQNPFMVMIQQGDQIRGALMRAKDSGVDSSNAIRNALDMMVTSFVDVGKMAGTFFVGSIESAGNAVKRLVTEKTFLGAAIDMVNAKMIAQGGVSANLASYIQKLGTLFTYLTGTAIVGATLALTTFTVAQLAVIKESDNLVRSIHSQGAAFGVSSEEANKMITSLSSVGVSSSKAAQAMQAMIEGGKQSKESFALVAEAATLMSTYAGISIDKTVKEFDKIADAPSKSLIELGKATGYVTLEMVQEVQQLEKVGATQEAVRRATEILAEAKKKAAGDIARDLSAVATAWIEIKTAIQAGFDAFKNSTVAEGTMKTLATIAKELAFAIYGIGTAVRVVKTLLGSFPEIGKNLDAISADVKAFRASLDAAAPSVGGLTAEQKQFNDQQLAGAEATEKLNKAISGGAKDNVKTMTQGAYVAARMTEELQKAGQGAVYSAELQKTAVAKFKKEYEELTKVKSGTKGPKPKETFSVDLTNEVEESKKAYDRQLKIAKDYESSRRDILKNSYEARMISLGDYVGQEIKLSIQARDNQLEIARQGNEEYNALMQKNRKAIEDAAQSAIDKGGSVSAIREKEKKDLEDLDRKVKGVNEAYLAQAEALDAATDKRFSDFYKELAKSAIESEKSLVDFTAAVQNNANAREEEIDLQLRLIGAHGAEAEAIKASSAAMKSYAPEIAKQTKLLADQEKVLRDLNEQMKDATPEEAERLDVLGMQALENTAKIRKNLDRTVAQARQDSEQAATDAATLYQINKYNELKGTLSDSIYTAIFEGGKKGGDVLKNYLMKEFKNFAIKVFIEPIVGSIIGDFTGGSGVSGVAGSVSFGGAMSIVSTAANLYKGGLSFLYGEAMKTAATQAISELGTRIGGEIGATLVMDSEFFGNIAGAVGNAFAGYGISKAIGYGYKTGLGNAVDIAGAIGSYFFGPIAGVVSGIANRAFGRKLKDTGIEGTFSNTGFEGQNYQFYKGGWLRSDKTKYSEMDQTMENLLSYQFKRLQLETAVLATSIGAGVDSIKDYTKKIKVSFKGLDEKQINEKLTEVYTEISNEMAAGVLRSLVKSSEPAKFEGVNIQENILGIEFTKLSQLEASVAVWNKSIETGFDAAGNKLSKGWIRELGDAVNQANDILDSHTEKLIEGYQWFGETFSETLNRLSSSITTVNESFRDLGYTLMDVSLQGASKASDIISLFGGEDQYVQATGYFYENAYSQEEKAANLTNRLSEALGRVNEKLPDSISGYRDLVDAYAKQGDAGREVWASLVQLFPAFEQLNNLNEELANSFNDLLGSYYEKFGTETEKVAFQTGLLQKSLAEVGIELPKTREEYVLQVKAYQNLGDAGKEVLTVLLENADAFDTLYPAVKDSTEVIKSVTDYYNELKNAVKSNEDIARERIILKERLFNATATTAEIAEKARNAIDPMNQSLYDTVLAAERLKAATENLPDALESSLGRAPVQEELNYWIDQVASGAITLQDAMKGIARDGSTEKLALRLLELNDAEGYLAETRNRVLSTMTPLQQEYQKQIWYLEDATKVAAKAKVIADQRLGLEGRLLTLQGNIVELRRRELELLDPSNQELQRRIWALEDLKAAEDAYNTALSERDNAQSAVDRVLGEATNAYLNAVQQQASAAQRVADLHRQAAEKMLSAGKSLRQYLTNELVSGSDPLTSQRIAQSTFSTLIARANTGDSEAYDQLSGAASTLLEKSRKVQSKYEFDRTRIDVLRSIQAAAEAADAAAAVSSAKADPVRDPMAEALAALQSADTALAEALRVATTIGAPLVETQRDLIAEYQKAKDTLVQAEDKLAKALDALNDIKKNTGDTVKAIGELKIKLEAIDLGASATIDFILGSDLPADLKELALGGPRTVQTTVDYLLGNLDSIPKQLMDVVLGTLTQFDVTTNFLVGSALPDDLKRLALTASDRVIKNTYDFLTGTTLPADLKQLAMLNSGTISRTINFVAGSAELTDAQKKVAFSTLGDYTTTVKAVLDSTMSDSIKKVVLDGVGVYETSVKAAAASDLPASLKKVLFDGAGDYLTTIKSTLDSSLTADQKELLLNATSSAQRVINMSATGGSLNDEQKTFLSTAAGTINRALALTASGGSLTAEQSNFLGYAAATVNRVLSLSATGGSLDANQKAILDAVNGTTNASVTANVSGTVGWTNSTVESYLRDIKDNTGKLATDIYAAYTSVTGLKLPNTSVHEALRAVSRESTAVKAGVYAQLRLGGYTDSLIRAVSDSVLGKQTDTDWAALKKLAGYSSGGYTGPGGMYEPAGIVHKGEVVWSQADVSRAGGVGVVESMRLGAGSTSVSFVDNSDLIEELKALRSEVVMLRSEVRADVSHNAKTARILDRVVPDGNSVQIVTATT